MSDSEIAVNTQPAPTPEAEDKLHRVDQVGKEMDTRRRYFRMFEEHALKMRPVHEIAKEFGVSKGTVYLALQWVRDRSPEIATGVQKLEVIQRREDCIRKLLKERENLLDDLDKVRSSGKKPSAGMYFALEAVVRQIREEETIIWKFNGLLKSELEEGAKAFGESLATLLPNAMKMLATVRSPKQDEPLPHDRLTESGLAGTINTTPPTPAENQG